MTVHFANPMVYHDGMAIDYLKWTTLNKISKLKEIRKTPDEINQRFKSKIYSDPVHISLQISLAERNCAVLSLVYVFWLNTHFQSPRKIM